MLEWYSPLADLEPERRARIPSDWSQWLGESFRGRVAYHRNFGLPTGLAAAQKVWLVIEEIDYRGIIFINDQSVGSMQLGELPMRVEVQTQLRKSNQLRIEVELPVQTDRGDRNGLAGGLIGGVRLEIEESD